MRNLHKILYSLKIKKIAGTEETVYEKGIQEEITTKQLRLFIAVPILCIAIAELLIFVHRIEAAVLIHIGIFIALTFSNIFIKDIKVHKIYMPLMLLSLLRLINFSMPVFLETTLYYYVFLYGALAIPISAILIHQKSSLVDIGINEKHLLGYFVLSVPLGFLLGLGEYLIIRPGYLIPDLTFGNLLKLTVIMVFFVGLIEELIFRSILQIRLEKALSVQESLIITSLLFGLMHSGYGTFIEILYTGLVGFIIGLVFYKTRNLSFIVFLRGLGNVFLYGILPFYLHGWT